MSKKAAKAEANETVTLTVDQLPPQSHTPSAHDIAEDAAEIVLGRMLSCGSCKHWKCTGASFGQCMLSGKYGSAPIITTDRASCSSWAE